jgi:hypothetical protein
LPSGDVQIYGWRSLYGNTVRFLDAVKFTTQTSLSLLILCKLSFSVAGFKMSSWPTLALKTSNRILYGIYRIYQKYFPVPCRSSPSLPKFYPLLGHENSEP